MTKSVEAVLRRHRAIMIVAIIVLALMAWVWTLTGAGMGMAPGASVFSSQGDEHAMAGMAMGGAMTAPTVWTEARFGLTFSMWWVMMVAMMLPSAAPTILLYAKAAASDRSAVRPSTESFLLGYLLVWGGFSLFATLSQMLLEQSDLLLQMHMTLKSRYFSAMLLIAAGLYQLSPFKETCLRHCRNPASFLSHHYRAGRIGALRMGIVHGSYCVGCCWLLMALLFVGGVMNLAWIALLTLLVATEKLLSFGRRLATFIGWVCVVGGAAILLV